MFVSSCGRGVQVGNFHFSLGPLQVVEALRINILLDILDIIIGFPWAKI